MQLTVGHRLSRHGGECGCARCVGFTGGPDGTAVTRLRHGAYSLVEIGGRAGHVAEGIKEAMLADDLWRESFVPTVQACAVVLVRLERAHAALAEVDERLDSQGALAPYLGGGDADPLRQLRDDARKWANSARGYLNDLGLTPRALAAITRDTGIGRSARASAALRALEEHVASEYGDEASR